MIKLHNVTKTYQVSQDTQFTALNNISFSIKQGEFVAITGPSGSGKSTLMHLIGLLDRPSSGEILVEGKNVENLSDDQLSQLRSEFVGFVFQQFNLISKMTVLENVMLPTIYARRALPFDPHERAIKLLGDVGLQDKMNSYPNKISGGQQQRTAIIRAMMMAPPLILADEPTGNLDSKSGREILDILAQLNKKEKLTVILVTHDPTVAARAKRIIRLRDGKLV
ncbi:ABC transporter ATP-binding protein [Candidatus Gottesmanbacteria bacterium]|nr:ABC transporter ATP-binding protein [Candidatus Gottesmanbacteria bacterium]